jgi:hypothetical protein
MKIARLDFYVVYVVEVNFDLQVKNRYCVPPIVNPLFFNVGRYEYNEARLLRSLHCRNKLRPTN